MLINVLSMSARQYYVPKSRSQISTILVPSTTMSAINTSRVIAKIITNCLITQEIYTLNYTNDFTELIKTVPEYFQGSRAVDC